MLENNNKNILFEILSPTMGKEMLKEKIDVFDKLLSLSVTCKDLETTGEYIAGMLDNNLFVLDDLAINIDNYFKLLLYIYDKNQYNYIIDNNKKLDVILKLLNLISENDIKNNSDNKIELIEDDKLNIYYKVNLINSIYKSIDDEKFKSICYITLLKGLIEAAWKHNNVIVDAYVNNKLDLKDYIDNIINDYEQQQYFTYIPSTVIPWRDTTSDITTDTVDDSLVDIINTNNLNMVKIIGYAGAGKSTTLKYLEYKDALECRNKEYKDNIPVLINLISINKQSDDINNLVKNLIKEKLNLEDNQIYDNLIQNKKIKLYLDGINEISVSNRKPVLASIEEFVKKNFLNTVVSDRDSDDASCLNDIPTFILRAFSEDDIKNFIYGNSKNPDNIFSKIKEISKTNKALKKEIIHPFMLKKLISLLENDEEIPTNSIELTGIFIDSLIKREIYDKHDESARYISTMLEYLSLDKNSDNSMSASFIIDTFNECKEICHIEIDSNYLLDLIVKMNLFKRYGLDSYAFTEPNYTAYFFVKAIEHGIERDLEGNNVRK